MDHLKKVYEIDQVINGRFPLGSNKWQLLKTRKRGQGNRREIWPTKKQKRSILSVPQRLLLPAKAFTSIHRYCSVLSNAKVKTLATVHFGKQRAQQVPSPHFSSRFKSISPRGSYVDGGLTRNNLI
jgi:hypothetical protein